MTEFFWNSHSFFLRTRKCSRKWNRKIQNIYVILNFPPSRFPHSQDKRARISKKFLPFFTVFLYIPCILRIMWRILLIDILSPHCFKFNPNPKPILSSVSMITRYIIFDNLVENNLIFFFFSGLWMLPFNSMVN